jgi:hypothetical protein
MTDKVLVKAIRPEFPVSGGPPIMVMDSGQGGGRGAVGVTRRQRALGGLGTAVGVLGSLAGQHRSLGGLVQSAISGGAQGSALGNALGRKFTSRERQARADYEEGVRQKYAARQASGDMGMFQGTRRMGKTVGTASDPMTMANQMRYVDRERAEAIERQKAQAAVEEARRRAHGRNLGEEDLANLERIDRLKRMMVVDNITFDAGLANMEAAGGPASRYPPPEADFQPTRPVVNAGGEVVHPDASQAVAVVQTTPLLTAPGAAAEIGRDEKTAIDAATQETIGVTGDGASKEQEQALANYQRPRPQPSQPQGTTVQTKLPVGVQDNETAGMSELQQRNMGAV